MGTFSIWHWLIVLIVVLVLFGGRGKVSGLMGDFASGIKAFKKNMADDNDASMETSELDRPTTPISGPAAKQNASRETVAPRETAAARHE